MLARIHVAAQARQVEQSSRDRQEVRPVGRHRRQLRAVHEACSSREQVRRPRAHDAVAVDREEVTDVIPLCRSNVFQA